MPMPTAMKKSPSSSPLNGSMSTSSSIRYSDSASSTPAMKAPRPIDSPTDCVSQALPTTSSSASATKISRAPTFATIRSTGRSSSRPTSTIPASSARAMPASRQPNASPWAEPAGASAPSTSSIGITARSWNSDTANADCPGTDFTMPRSASTCSAIAVEDIAQAMPSTMPTGHEVPAARRAIAATAATVTTTCSSPSPKIERRSDHSRLGSSSRPTRNSSITTPSSETCATRSKSVTSARPQGPIATPATR